MTAAATINRTTSMLFMFIWVYNARAELDSGFVLRTASPGLAGTGG